MKLPRTLTIRGQLLLLVLGLSIPFLAFVVFSAARQASHDREQAGHQMLGIARVTAARLDDHVGDIAQLLSTLGVALSTDPRDTAANDALLSRMAGHMPTQIGQLGIWALDGRNIGAMNPALRAARADVSGSAFFQRAIAGPGLAVDGPTLSPVNNQKVSIFALRVERAGKPAGLVGVSVPTSRLQSLLGPVDGMPPGSVVTISDLQGVVLARSLDPERWVGKNLRDVRTVQPEVGGVSFAPGVDGVARIAGLAATYRLPWVVYVGQPVEAALAPAHARLVQGLAAGGAALVVGLLLSAWAAGRIARPLRQLQADAGVFEQGLLAHRSSARGAAEIASLAATVNQMAAALDQRTQLLQDSQAELADLYDNAPCGHFSLDDTGRFVHINDTALVWMGQPRQAVIGTRLLDWLRPEGQASFQTHFPQLLQEGRLSGVEFDMPPPAGQPGRPRRVAVSATAPADSNGRVASARAVMFDITELQALRTALKRLSDEQRAMLDTDMFGMVKLHERRLVWVNAGVARLLGWRVDELLGRPSRMVYADDAGYQRVGAEAYPQIAAGHTYRGQVQLARKDGTPVWVDMMGIALPGSPGHAICVVVDITDRKQADDNRMRALRMEAENRQLAETTRLKTVFLANMSHELHTPLNAVLGYAHLLRAGKIAPDSPKFASYLGQIETSGRQLLGLIDATLNLARAESGKLDLQPAPVSLPVLIGEVVALLQSQIAAKQITVAVEVDPLVADVVTDPTRLTQLLATYLSNAVKFSADAALVTVRALPATPAETGRFRVEVQDSGIGIAPKDQPRLFVAFQQLSEGVTKLFPGAGVGLALARRIVEAQGGTVGVDSALGAGSTFWAVLPTGRCP